MAKECERCGAKKSSPEAGPYDMLDYCARCSTDLCDKCMANGCCGNTPAVSGTAEDAAVAEATEGGDAEGESQ